MMENIELISTEKLIDEVFKRFDSAIFYGVKKKTESNKDDEDKFITNENDVYWWHYIGCRVACLGLCMIMEDKLKENIKDNLPIDKEDF